MPGKSNDTGYPPEVGKHAHTPKFPATQAYYKKMKGADKPDSFDAPIIHDDRNPDTEEPFTPIFSWIIAKAKDLLVKINCATSDPSYAKAVEDFEKFVEYLHNRTPQSTPPRDQSTGQPYDWARVGPTISEAAIEPVFSGGNLTGAVVTVTWLGGTHTSSSSTSVP